MEDIPAPAPSVDKIAGGEAQKRTRDPVRLSYANTEIIVRQPSGRPGTPHRYFDSSHLVSFGEENSGAGSGLCEGGNDSVQKKSSRTSDAVESSGEDDSRGLLVDQVVHRHVNGLCVVTAGEALGKLCSSSSPSVSVATVEFLKAECENQSVGGKKKKQKKAKFARNKNRAKGGEEEKGAASPDDVLAIVNLSDGRKVKLRCCVLGTILEVNRRLEGTNGNPSLLVTDPLLDGYLAVILPTGPFPLPLKNKDSTCDS